MNGQSTPAGEALWGVEACLLAIAGVIPLIVFLRVVSVEGQPMEYWAAYKEYWDFFAFYRARWLCVLAAGAGIAWWQAGVPVVYGRAQRWLAVLAWGAVVSTVFAQRPGLAIDGAPDRCEGLVVHLAYYLIAFLAIQTAVHRPTYPPRLVGMVLAGAVLVGVVGLAQFLDHDPLRTTWGRNLILPSELQHLGERMGFLVSPTMVYGVFSNPNYTGSYSAMVMVLTFGAVWFGRSWLGRWRWAAVGLFWLLFITWLGCRSKAGLLGGSLGMIGVIILGRKAWRENLAIFIVLVVGCGGLLFWMDLRSMKADRADRLFNNLSTKRIDHVPSIPTDFQDLVLGSDSFDLIFASNRLRCERASDGVFVFRNAEGSVVPYAWRVQTLVFPPEDFRGFLVKVATASQVVQVTREDITLNLMYTDQGFRLLDSYLQPRSLRAIERVPFPATDRWGNGRGFIWSRSWPLLKKAMVVGYGPDMFLNHFPQDDFLAKIRAGYPLGWLVDKPHNLYLQIGINLGGIALAAFLLLCGEYLLVTGRRGWARLGDSSPRGAIEVTMAAAVGAYLAAGFFNDSVVAVAPVFWTLLGAGIGLNRIPVGAEMAPGSETLG